jgi:hypothetical protein
LDDIAERCLGGEIHRGALRDCLTDRGAPGDTYINRPTANKPGRASLKSRVSLCWATSFRERTAQMTHRHRLSRILPILRSQRLSPGVPHALFEQVRH